MVDKVRPLKMENSNGGTEEDVNPTETNPNEDYLATKGIAFEGQDGRRIEIDASGNIQFVDANNPSGRTLKNITDQINTKYDASNPNGYETPAQLNLRDTANRSRANHTGTQLASTISDFTSAVLSTVLSGLSLLTSTPIVATDTILVAFGKVQAQLNLFNTLVTPQPTSTTNSAGTSTAHARADHLHDTVIVHDRVASTTLTTTTSTTDVQLGIATLTPSAGKYLGLGRAVVGNSNNGRLVYMSIYVGGVKIAGSECLTRIASGNANFGNADLFTLICDAEFTVNGSQNVELRWRTSANTAQANNYALTLFRVGP